MNILSLSIYTLFIRFVLICIKYNNVIRFLIKNLTNRDIFKV